MRYQPAVEPKQWLMNPIMAGVWDIRIIAGVGGKFTSPYYLPKYWSNHYQTLQGNSVYTEDILATGSILLFPLLTDSYPEPNYCVIFFLRLDCRWGGLILQNKIFLFYSYSYSYSKKRMMVGYLMRKLKGLEAQKEVIVSLVSFGVGNHAKKISLC